MGQIRAYTPRYLLHRTSVRARRHAPHLERSCFRRSTISTDSEARR